MQFAQDLSDRQAADAVRSRIDWVLAVVRGLNRLALVRETMTQALETLARVALGWLRAHPRPDWVDRRRRYFSDDWPKGKEVQQTIAETIGTVGATLLAGIYSSTESGSTRYRPLKSCAGSGCITPFRSRSRCAGALKRKGFHHLHDSSILLMTLMPAMPARPPVPGPATRYISLRPAMMTCPV